MPLNRYVTTVRYMDGSFKDVFDRLKEEGLYDNLSLSFMEIITEFRSHKKAR
ncbi:hypothetical protein KHA80_05130 [Anaerobacillus sp. HL2]|nr:hypothetical protein KHA80_05130 [Anaerobacillus sp. HL2]